MPRPSARLLPRRFCLEQGSLSTTRRGKPRLRGALWRVRAICSTPIKTTLNRLSTAIDLRYDGDPTTVDEFDGRFTDSQLFTLKNETRRSRDYAVLGVGGAYLFQVLDAYASGFLVEFDVSPTLTGSLSPAVEPLAPLGAKLTFAWP